MTVIFQRQIQNNVRSSEILLLSYALKMCRSLIPRPLFLLHNLPSYWRWLSLQRIRCFLVFACFFFYLKVILFVFLASFNFCKQEAVEKIHSGEYINCVDLWVNFISANVQDCDLQPLLYTIVQVINGVAQLIIGPRYLLLRVKCIHWLNHLSRTSGIFIPIASLVLDMLEYKTTNDGEKQEQKLEAVSTVKVRNLAL